MARLLPALVFGLVWHLLWVWVGIGEAWVSLLILVGVASFFASANAVSQVAAWAWVRDALRRSASVVDAVSRFLPREDDDGWGEAEGVLSVAAAAAGFGIVQFVDLSAGGDVVARIVMLSVAVVLLGIDVAAGVWGVEEARATGPLVEVKGGSDGGLEASVPLPAALGGGDGGGKLRFKLDL